MIKPEEILSKKRVHFVGAGGVGMSALAEFLLHNGAGISGSDLRESDLTRRLAALGATVFSGHDEQYAKDSDCLVYTSAVSADNPELVYAFKNGIPVFRREEALGAVFNGFVDRISVCGMHGKTTTTALLAHILTVCGKDPTAFVGGICNDLGGNLRIGKSGNCVAEACEYRRSFLNLFPTVNCFLNIDKDHLDYYRDFDDIKSAFRRFAQNTAPGGQVIVNGDDEELAVWKNTTTFGLGEENDFYAADLRHNKGFFSFSVKRKGTPLTELNLKIPGAHNVYNALCSFAAASTQGYFKFFSTEFHSIISIVFAVIIEKPI